MELQDSESCPYFFYDELLFMYAKEMNGAVCTG